MEPTPSQPTRKRRRWLIVAVLLFVVSTASWWYWPRGDARFVGKWRRQTDSTSEVVWTFVFNSNGTGSTGLIDKTGRASSSNWFWSVDGNVLNLGTDYGRWEGVAQWLSLQFDDRTGKTFEPFQSQLQVLRIDSNTIELGSGSIRLILTRIPE